LGVASLDIHFTANNSGIYHSIYDDFDWFSHYSDGDFTYGRALAQVDATAMMRFADAPVLPFEFGRFASAVSGYVDDIAGLPGSNRKHWLTEVRSEVANLEETAGRFDSVYAEAQPRLATASPAKLAALNRILYRSERALTLDPGLPGRPWYRHRIYAPGQYTGYEAKTLPGIREAVEAGKADEAEQQAAQVIQVLRKLNDEIAEAAKLTGEL
jgi:N-acetylated-alpha-linked acidic dipeptidase